MNTIVNLWPVALALGVAVSLQWAVLRTKYRIELTRQRARHVQQRHTTSRNLEQFKRQIGQLQHDLAAARMQAKRLSHDGAALQRRAREELLRTLDDAPTSRHGLPINGFADTQPSPLSPPCVGLMFR
ncbi:hypothetical protein [Piscinibacter sp.]|jgi:Mn-dependent DtxR family transcriptional regulator|uniref:hypothetical protein n=1 Tax=Piscinibacter sp. TaxID=1903157 RepID=UPI003559F909